MINGDESAFLNLTKKVFFFVFFQYIAGTEGQIPAGKIGVGVSQKNFAL